MPTRMLLLAFTIAITATFGLTQAPKTPVKVPGQVDPKQFKTICDTADVVVIGKAFAILEATLDSEPPTPVYSAAQIETKGMKFLKGREKVGGNPERRVASAFADLSQASELLMGKTVIVAFKWEGQNPKLLMLSATNETDLAMISAKFPEAK